MHRVVSRRVVMCGVMLQCVVSHTVVWCNVWSVVCGLLWCGLMLSQRQGMVRLNAAYYCGVV